MYLDDGSGIFNLRLQLQYEVLLEAKQLGVFS